MTTINANSFIIQDFANLQNVNAENMNTFYQNIDQKISAYFPNAPLLLNGIKITQTGTTNVFSFTSGQIRFVDQVNLDSGATVQMTIANVPTITNLTITVGGSGSTPQYYIVAKLTLTALDSFKISTSATILGNAMTLADIASQSNPNLYVPIATIITNFSGYSYGYDTMCIVNFPVVIYNNFNVAYGTNVLNYNITNSRNNAFGTNVLSNNTAGFNNCGFGTSVLSNNTTGFKNCAFGDNTLVANTDGEESCAFGESALSRNIGGSFNNAFGANALSNNTTGFSNCGFGTDVLSSNNNGHNNCAFGESALVGNTTGNSNNAFGSLALASNIDGGINCAFGASALANNTTGSDNNAFGYSSLFSNNSNNNNAFGSFALFHNDTGSFNNVFGNSSLPDNITGSNNCAFGESTMFQGTGNDNNSAFGYRALYSLIGTYTNCSGFGANSAVTASNQVQLGDSSTTVYVYGTVQSRSDVRDKVDIRDTQLGLDFINKLRPVDYKLDMRDDYKPLKPIEPKRPIEDASEEELISYKIQVQEFKEKVAQCGIDSKLDNLKSDGTYTRNRYHHGIIAQDIQQIIQDTGIDFGGFQDHKIQGGDDVLTIGYNEFIAPLIKAIQELSKKVTNLEQQLYKKD